MIETSLLLDFSIKRIPEFCENCTITDKILFPLLGWGLFLGILVILLAALLLLSVNKRKRIWNWLDHRNLFPAFLLVWLLGFSIYIVGMYTGERESLFGNIFMAVIHAFGIFILNSDVSAIHNPFHNNWLYMSFFSLVHFAAACISMLFVIKHFGFNILASIRMFFASCSISKKKKMTYIFWGMNDATYHLAKSINEYHKGNKETHRIVIIRSHTEKNITSVRNGMERLFNFLSLRNKDLDQLMEIDCLTTNTFVSLSKLETENDGNSTDVWRMLGLNNVAKLASKRTTGNVHIFFLSDDWAENIQAVENLKKDKTLAGIIVQGSEKGNAEASVDGEKQQERKVKIYCHARYNSINRVTEDLDTANSIDVHIVDSSHLAIERLKREARYQPINYVEIDRQENLGTVKSAFTSLIVGFGETGKDALRFLYEFGAFVDSKSPDKTRRSPFYCHVVDNRMDKLKGSFKNAAPAMFTNKNPDGSPLVYLHSIDHNSDEFYNKLLPELSQQLNYIIICINNDEEAITLAVRILKYLRRKGRDFTKLSLFIRSYSPVSYPLMQKIKEHYDEGENRIEIFGRIEDICTYDMIIRDEFEERGRAYYETYRSLHPEHNDEGTWDQRRRKMKGLTELKKTGIDDTTGCAIFEETPIANPKPATLDCLQSLRRKERQDKSNALHEATKIKILETIIPDWKNIIVPKIFAYENEGDKAIVRKKRMLIDKRGHKEVRYPELNDKEQTLMDNLARLEHIRWISSHEVLGYTAMDDHMENGDLPFDESRMTHNCLTSWEQLDDESDQTPSIGNYKLFDYGVVETTIKINRNKDEQD